RAMSGNRSRGFSLAVIALVALLLGGSGCQPQAAKDDKPVARPNIAIDRPTVDAKTEPSAAQKKTSSLDPRLSQPFAAAVRLEPPDGELLLDVTSAGKNVAKMFLAIKGGDGKPGLWDEIRFVT